MKLESDDWPLFGWTTDMRPALRKASERRESVVLGTVIGAQGSVPRPPGSQMILRYANAVGYFSGGCIEADVANHAVAVLDDGLPRHLVYGQSSPWIDIRMLCGGSLHIFLERIEPDEPAVAALLKFGEHRRRAKWTTDGSNRKVEQDTKSGPDLSIASKGYSLCYDPRWRVVVVGGDPTVLAIAKLAALSEFDVTIVRPGGPGGEPPVENVAYSRDDVSRAIGMLGTDNWTAIVTATHDDVLDDEAIIAGLQGSIGYIGVLGAVRRVAPRRERLLSAGLSPAQIDIVRSPIGSVRSGKAPWEIAVSVIAEIMQVRAKAPTLGAALR